MNILGWRRGSFCVGVRAKKGGYHSVKLCGSFFPFLAFFALFFVPIQLFFSFPILFFAYGKERGSLHNVLKIKPIIRLYKSLKCLFLILYSGGY